MKNIFKKTNHTQTPNSKTSFLSRNAPQIIQNNNFITLNNNQTIITNFNNILSNQVPKRHSGSTSNRIQHQRSNSVMSIHDNTQSFISTNNSLRSEYSPNNSRIYYQTPKYSRPNRSFDPIRRNTGNMLNFKYSNGYPKSNNIIPNTTHAKKTLQESKLSQTSNLKFSIVKGNSNFIKSKKREFSRNSSINKLNQNSRKNSSQIRSKSPRYLNWGMESQVNSRINYDYSKPYKSPDLVKYDRNSRKNSKNYNPLQTKAVKVNKQYSNQVNPNQPISLANSKHFEKVKTDSLLLKLKENKVENIDFYNLDLGNKKMKDNANRIHNNERKYNTSSKSYLKLTPTSNKYIKN